MRKANKLEMTIVVKSSSCTMLAVGISQQLISSFGDRETSCGLGLV